MVTDVAQWTDHTRRGVDAMEPLRMKWLMLSTISWVIVIVGAGATCLVYSSHQHDPAPAWITAGGALVAALVFHAMASAQSKLLQTRFDQWRAKTVSMIDDTASFAARNGIPQSDFDGSGLNDATYNRYSSWDQLHVGSVRSGALSVKHVYQETYWVTEYHTDSQGRSQSRQVQKTRTVVVPVFDGALLVVEAKLPHPTWLMVRHKKQGLPKGLTRMTVASPSLANHCAVGAADQFAAHRVLTPSFMEEIWDFTTQFSSMPGYSYRHELLYLTLPGFSFNVGKRPAKWSPVTTARLEEVKHACEGSIAFLNNAAAKLKPT